RALAGELRAQVEELKRSTPNDSERLVKHNDLVAFFEKMATGLVQLAEALDQAVARATDGKPEPVFLGEAARIALDLHLGLMEWLEVNRTWVVDIPMRMTFYGLGISFLHFIGADSFAAVAGLTALVFRRAPRTKVASKKDSRSKGKAAGRRGNPDST